VRWKIELARSRTASAEFPLKSPGEVEYANAMALGIGHKEAIRSDGDRARSLDVIANLKAQFALFAENDNLPQIGIADEERPVSFSDCDRGEKPDWANLFPAMPLSGLAIVEADRVGTGIGEAKVFIFVESEAEWFSEDIDGCPAPGEPLSEAFENRGFGAEIGGRREATDIGDTGGLGRRWPD